MQTPKRNKKIAYFLTPIALASAQLITSIAQANDVVGTLPTVEVVGVSPVASFNIPLNQYPGNIQVLRENDIESQKSSSFSELLGRSAASVTLNEIQGNPFQLDLNYRGQRLSSVLGSPQGVSAYLDGVRINEAFGDVISWDMLPESAISTMTVVPGSNPMYGMNTLSGALVMTTKSGLTHEGNEIEVSGGSFGRIRTDAGMGKKLSDGYHFYVAATGFRENGWREKSDSKLVNTFMKYGRETDKTSWNVSFLAGTSDLKGNGLLPTSQYTSDYRGGYTFYDITKTKAQQLSFDFSHKLSNEEKISLVTWVRNAKRSANGGDVDENFLETCMVIGGACSNYAGIGAVINKSTAKADTLGFSLQWDKKIDAHKLFFGGMTQYVKTRYQSYEGDADHFVDRVADVSAVTRYVQQADHKGQVAQYALYLGDIYTPVSGTLFSSSLRYDFTKVKNDLKSLETGLQNPNFSNSGHRHDSAESFNYKKLNPSFGFSQVLTAQSTVFGNWSQGMRVPTAFELGCADPLYPCRVPTGLQDDPYLQPIISQTTEVGLRFNPDQNTRLTVTGFSNVNRNDVAFVRATAINSQAAGYFKNIGNTLRQGIELAGRYKQSLWEVGASYTYLKATYRSEVLLPSVGGYQSDAHITTTKGTRIAGLPEHIFKLAGLYRVTPQWRVGADVQAFGSQVVAGNENGTTESGASGKDKLAGYSILNLNTNYEISKGLNAFMRVNNVFDKRYASYASLGYDVFAPAGQATETVLYAPGAPRAVFGGVRYEWK
jgi:outer membrane receptor protein involved in Fe transport